MPRKESVSKQKAESVSPIGRRKIQKQDEWAGFAQVNVSEFEREAFDLWLSENTTHVFPLLLDSLAEGLKLTAVWDKGNDCFILSLTGRPDELGVREWTATLSGRGATFDEALNVLIYKHVEVTGGDWVDWLVNGAKTRRNFG